MVISSASYVINAALMLKTHCDFFYSVGWELSSFPKLFTVKSHIFSCLFSTKYFVLGYSLWDNLMHYKKVGVVYMLTPH